MSRYGKDAPKTGTNVVLGFLLSVLVHGGLIAGTIFLGKKAVAEAEPRVVNVLEARLVRLGEELPKHLLPQIHAAPAPKVDLGVKLTSKEDVTPEPPEEKKPKKKEENPEDELRAKLALTAPTRRTGTGGAGDHTSGRNLPQSGSRSGTADGEALSARDAQEGDLWVTSVTRLLRGALDVPSVIPTEHYPMLSNIVEVSFDESGTITGWKIVKRASGSPHAGLFDGAVDAVRRKVKELPAPPAGALKKYKARRLRLKMVPQ
jgi:outer membrane biosynthesis protein TonB